MRAVGAHGRTVRHHPRFDDGTGYTVQLNNSTLLAELCSSDVVSDLRSRDIAAGGKARRSCLPFIAQPSRGPDAMVVVLNLGRHQQRKRTRCGQQ